LLHQRIIIFAVVGVLCVSFLARREAKDVQLPRAPKYD